MPIISAVDTALMGGLSVLHLGAIGLGSMIFNFIYWNFGFLRMGTTGMVAQAHGKKLNSEVAKIGIRSLLIALVISALLMILSSGIYELSSVALNISNDQTSLVKEYFMIRIWAAPATICLYVIMGWFFGLQNVIYPLIVTLLINISNAFLSFYFVMSLGMEIRGVAYGTVIAQYLGLALSLVLVTNKYKDYFKVSINEIRGKLADWSSLFTVNSFLFIRTVCLTFAFAFFYAQSSKEGAIILATHVVLLQFSNWISYGIDGFAFASESMVGKYYGANDKASLKKTIDLTFMWSFLLAAFFALFYYGFEMSILNIFTEDGNVINLALEYRIWMLILPLAACSCYIWDGIYIGLTAVKSMMVAMVISLLFFLAYFYLIVESGYSNLWIALIAFLFIRGVLQFGIWHKSLKYNVI